MLASASEGDLFEAAKKGDVTAVQGALEKGEKPNQKHDGPASLGSAEVTHPELFGVANTGQGLTPLFVAAASGNVAIARLLLAHRANPDTSSGHTIVLSTNTAMGVSRNLLPVYGDTPLCAAIRYAGNPSMARLLLDSGADPDTSTKEWWFSTRASSNAWNPKALGPALRRSPVKTTLLHRGFEGWFLRKNWSPLHLAVLRVSQDFVQMLLDKRAKGNVENEDGETPLDVAVRLDRTQHAELLRDAR